MQTISCSSVDAYRSQVSEDYVGSAITVIYTREKKTNSRRLLFAVVELLPSWIESADFELPYSSSGTSALEITIRRVSYSSAIDGLNWYLHCRDGGSPELPISSEDRKKGWDRKGPRQLEIGELGEEPPFPYAVFAHEYFWDEAPIWGTYPGGYRWHQLRALADRNIFDFWPDATSYEDMRAWLRDHLPFDLFSRPLALGSVHLICHNPLFRSVRYFPSSIDPRKILIKVLPGPSKDVCGLTVQLREDRPNGPSRRQIFELKEPTAVVECPYELHSIGVDILCPKRGLLYHSEAAPFIKSISLNMGIITKQRVVTLPRRSRRHGESREITNVVGFQSPMEIGEHQEKASAISIIATERSKVESAKLGERLGQRWFDNDRTVASNEIRDLLASAKEDVLIVDPYFGQFELLQFALAVSDPKTHIRILTSAEYLRGKADQAGELRLAEMLLKQFKSVQKQDSDLKHLEIRVMPGARAEIHDRFIKTPEEIWHIGSSLNEFGSRGTMTMRLPNPYPVETRLELAWQKAVSLIDFINRKDSPNKK